MLLTPYKVPWGPRSTSIRSRSLVMVRAYRRWNDSGDLRKSILQSRMTTAHELVVRKHRYPHRHILQSLLSPLGRDHDLLYARRQSGRSLPTDEQVPTSLHWMPRSRSLSGHCHVRISVSVCERIYAPSRATGSDWTYRPACGS